MFKPTKLIPILLGAVLFMSCGDDKDKEVVPDNEIPTEFSDLSVEQNKSNLESNGIELVGHIRDLKNSAGVKTSISLSHFVSSADLPETGRVASLQPLDLIRSLAEFGQGQKSAAKVLSGFRSKETDPQTAQEVFDEYEGVFAYNAAEETWSHTPATDGKIVFRFPSTKEGTVNNAEFAIYGYASTQVNNPEAEYTGDLPTALKADLTVDNTKQIGYTFSAAYKSNGEPTSVETVLTINAFKFTAKVVNTTDEVSLDYSLLHADKNLISLGAGATGQFTSTNVDNSEGPGDVVKTAEAYFQLMNIKFGSEVNVEGLDNALSGDELTAEQEAAAWNSHAVMVVFYADSKKKIADTEFYATTEEDSWTICGDINGDGIDDGCQTQTETYETVDVRLVFADGSKSDLATYTEVGFDDVQQELEDFFDELENELD